MLSSRPNGAQRSEGRDLSNLLPELRRSKQADHSLELLGAMQPSTGPYTSVLRGDVSWFLASASMGPGSHFAPLRSVGMTPSLESLCAWISSLAINLSNCAL